MSAALRKSQASFGRGRTQVLANAYPSPRLTAVLVQLWRVQQRLLACSCVSRLCEQRTTSFSQRKRRYNSYYDSRGRYRSI